MKAKRVTHGDGSLYGIRWDCPGCGASHVVPTTGPNSWGKEWGFNDDLEHPTLTPSVLVHPHGILLEDGSVGQSPLCHSFVRNGRIEFLGDCTHALAGHTFDMNDIEAA